MKPFSSIERACAVCQPVPCVRALYESGALFQMSHLKLHTSHFTMHSSHYTLDTSHSTLHLISSELFSNVISVPLNYFHLIWALLNLFHLIKLFLTHLSSSVHQNTFTVRENLLHTKTVASIMLLHREFFCTQTGHIEAFGHKRVYTEKLLHRDAFTHSSFYT